MKHIKTVNKPSMVASLQDGRLRRRGAAHLPSACKTSCTVGNQVCENNTVKSLPIWEGFCYQRSNGG